MKIVIFGLAGSGTSTVGKLLAKELGYTFMSTGNMFREYAEEAGMSLYEFENTIAKEDENFDKKLDAKTAEYGQKNDNFIFESRLAWNFIPESFKVYIDCNTEERYRRIHEREGGDIQEIIKNNTLREKELEERYAEVYPDITFPPKKELFDLCIDASSISPGEIILEIMKTIEKGNSIS